MRAALPHVFGFGVALALAVTLSLALSGCFPGQFPSPSVRPPPAPQPKGTTANTPHTFGAPKPTWQSADAAGG